MYRKNVIQDFTPFTFKPITNENLEESVDMKYFMKLVTGFHGEIKFRFVNLQRFRDPFHPTAN